MTVCIAAICHGHGSPYVIGVTDHKLTAGDVTFEPDTAKVWPMGNGIAALLAGDIAVQAEICDRATRKKLGTVDEALDAYCSALTAFNRSESERKVLATYGMTMKSFLAEQQRMSDKFVRQLKQQIEAAKADIETIICGVDKTGPHLYTVDYNGCRSRSTNIGFAAIGDGRRHAASQFMFAQYKSDWLVEKALLLLYTAKKRAEVASSVGHSDDMFYIDNSTGPQELNSKLCEKLKVAYEMVQEAQQVATEEAEEQILKFFDQPVPDEEDQGEAVEVTSADPPALPAPGPDQTSKPEGSA